MTTSCPIPSANHEIITLEHGSGGKSARELIERIFLPAFHNPALEMMHDGAALTLSNGRIAFTTDSYVVQPIFFPGGDIGKLAVTGTINDLAMCGAKPLYLSCSFIIEEGFLQSDLQRIVDSMQMQAKLHSVEIVTGDTKVIERQGAPNIFINTSGIGMQLSPSPIDPLHIKPGDAIIVSNDIGRHGIAVMAEREGFTFDEPLLSDCAVVAPLVEKLIQEDIEVHCLRDPTRGGLATALVEIAEKAQLGFLLKEDQIPVEKLVANVCEILGLDVLHIACEGCFIAFVPENQANDALAIMRRYQIGRRAALIGKVESFSKSGKVRMKNTYGSERFLHQLSGSHLPRIC